jgi:hypothetical protein
MPKIVKFILVCLICIGVVLGLTMLVQWLFEV